MQHCCDVCLLAYKDTDDLIQIEMSLFNTNYVLVDDVSGIKANWSTSDNKIFSASNGVLQLTG
jgi:hypothetical protein